MRIQLAKETRQLPVGGKVQWPGVLVFENFSDGITISEHSRIRILTLRVSWKQPIVGQILSQIEKLFFLEIWDVPWRISMATIRRGTFTWHLHFVPGLLQKIALNRPLFHYLSIQTRLSSDDSWTRSMILLCSHHRMMIPQ